MLCHNVNITPCVVFPSEKPQLMRRMQRPAVSFARGMKTAAQGQTLAEDAKVRDEGDKQDDTQNHKEKFQGKNPFLYRTVTLS